MTYDTSALLDKLRENFRAGLTERFDLLENNVLQFEAGDQDAFDELFRQVHSLKGAGGTFGMALITTICHQFESFILEARADFDQAACSFALAYVDLLRRAGEIKRRESGTIAVLAELDILRKASMRAQASAMVVIPSVSTRKLVQVRLAQLSLRQMSLTHGLPALERLLHEPFDMLVVARELPDLNALALVAAVRESGGCNRDMPVILISSNPVVLPPYLRIGTVIRRDVSLEKHLVDAVGEVLKVKRVH